VKKWSDKELIYLKDNYKTKINKEICDVLHRSSSSVRFMASKLELRKNEEVVCKARKHTNIELSKEILEKLYLKDKKSVRKIAKEIGLGRNTILYYLNKYNILRRSISEANKSFYSDGGKIWKAGLTKENDKRVFIATEKMKLTKKRQKEEKIKVIEEKIKMPLKEAINKFYWIDNLTQEKIAKSLGMPRERIIRLMKEFDLSKRPNFEFISKLKGKNHPSYGKKWEDIYGVEEAKKLKAKRSAWGRENIIKRLKNNQMPFSNTKIERIMARALAKRNIPYLTQYEIDNKFVCDFALPKHRIIIECDGDYWHANPLFYDINKLGLRQKRNTQRDRFKNEYLKRKGWKVLRFFESDIKKSPSECVNIVEEQIKKVANPFDSL